MEPKFLEFASHLINYHLSIVLFFINEIIRWEIETDQNKKVRISKK